ncbi:MAG: FG-GAP-like repeat-containing protein [Saprospiraceae bacterium]
MKAIFLCLLWIATAPLYAQLWYEDVADWYNINHRFNAFNLGGGVSFRDFDGDGWDDITMGTAVGENIKFYRNMGSFFVALPPLVPLQEEVKQVLWADIDNDGDQDLFVATWDGLNRLYEQTSPLQFTDITLAAGLPSFISRTYGATFGDYDRDGWLDLYFGLRIPFMPENNQHLLFRNNGNGTFTNTTDAAQTADTGGLPFCSVFVDYNNDGWPDIYTSHDRFFTTNTLLENNGDGTFSQAGPAAQADIAIDAMSVSVADYNNDGYLDIYCTNIPDGNALLHNNGPDDQGQYTFTERGIAAGVGFFGNAWGASWLDADNDGWLDLYVSGADAGTTVNSAAFYKNEQDDTFSQPMIGFSGDTVISHANAVGDFNNDGATDILVCNTYPYYSQLWSSEPTDNHWIKIRLEGTFSNRDAIGTRLLCYANGHFQQRYTQTATSFLGQHTATEHLGVGSAEIVDSLVIIWPSGLEERYYELATNVRYSLREGSTAGDPPLPDPWNTPEVITHQQETPPAKPALFPIPATSVIHCHNPTPEDLILRCTNLSGQLLFTTTVPQYANTSIPIAHLPAGIYYFQSDSGIRWKWVKL